MKLLHEIAIFQTVKSKVIISLFQTVRLSVSISLRNLYNSLNSIKEIRIYTGWRPVVAVFVTICFPVADIIVLSDSIFWLNKLGVNVGIILIYFFFK